ATLQLVAVVPEQDPVDVLEEVVGGAGGEDPHLTVYGVAEGLLPGLGGGGGGGDGDGGVGDGQAHLGPVLAGAVYDLDLSVRPGGDDFRPPDGDVDLGAGGERGGAGRGFLVHSCAAFR